VLSRRLRCHANDQKRSLRFVLAQIVGKMHYNAGACFLLI
jgi:hypothetical protein